MKTTKATALLLCLLLSGCRPVYVIVTQEAPKQPERIEIKTDQPWSRTNLQDVLNTVKMQTSLATVRTKRHIKRIENYDKNEN